MKTLKCTASSLVIRATPGGVDTGARVRSEELVQAHGQSYDGAWTYIVAGGGAGWAATQYLAALPAAPASTVPLPLVSRASWGSKYATSQPMTPDPKKLVVVHHFASPDVPVNATPEQEAEALRGVEKYHVETHGWKAIGYSFVIFESGRIYEGRGWGQIGAHTPGKNSSAHGICFGMNGQVRPATAAVVASFRALINEGKKRGWVSYGWAIGGHRDFDDTTCPGDKVYAQLGELHS